MKARIARFIFLLLFPALVLAKNGSPVVGGGRGGGGGILRTIRLITTLNFNELLNDPIFWVLMLIVIGIVVWLFKKEAILDALAGTGKQK